MRGETPAFAAPLATFVVPRFSLAGVPHLLGSDRVGAVRVHVLGPEGTNIEQAGQAWAAARGIADKTSYMLCPTPEEEVERCRQETRPGVLPIFVLCAVYYQLNVLFFGNPDCILFLDSLSMPLDELQLAGRPGTPAAGGGTVIVHPSPSVLVAGRDGYDAVPARSNAEAARRCADGGEGGDGGDVLCITTRTAGRIHGLQTLHRFGSPPMLFTFGTTPHGIHLLEQAASAGVGATGAGEC